MTPTTILISILFFITALLYASVGNAGATSYLAVMALFGFPPEEMKSTALVLNILVASIAAIKFYRAGHFTFAIFWPLALASIPMAFIGGRILLPEMIYKPVISLVLIYTGFRLINLKSAEENGKTIHPAPLWAALATGAVIGLLAGFTGIGGGILLSPVLMLFSWASAYQAAAIAAVFNLVNSIAGLSGHLIVIQTLPAAMPLWAISAGIGGWIGGELGSRRFESRRLQQILAIILFIAAIRLFVM